MIICPDNNVTDGWGKHGSQLDAINTLARTVKGFLASAEGVRLYQIALEASPYGPCLEIGSYCGKSTLYIGAACRQNDAQLFAIDHHRGSEEQQPGEEYFDPELFDVHSHRVNTFGPFIATLERANLLQTVIPLVAASEVVARFWATPLSLVFIDGGHAYDTVATDFRSWSPFIIAGGFLIFHDIYEDPRQGGQAPYLIYQQAMQSGEYEHIERTQTLGVLKKKACAPNGLQRNL
jgi:predicted O-methyltransferase YrrM